jgi:hypothetical protein
MDRHVDYRNGSNLPVAALRPFEEQHYPVKHWAARWGFSIKIVRLWFHDEYGPGILRHENLGRRKKRDYVTLMISATAAERVYRKHCPISATH